MLTQLQISLLSRSDSTFAAAHNLKMDDNDYAIPKGFPEDCALYNYHNDKGVWLVDISKDRWDMKKAIKIMRIV